MLPFLIWQGRERCPNDCSRVATRITENLVLKHGSSVRIAEAHIICVYFAETPLSLFRGSLTRGKLMMG
jgi:hypothetical protein